ncbi:GerMN domain-containing protein [Alkalithermobacter paradoxus]|uniref:Sporulation and spore germination n=1 Tax=Alkalithermobacter paradoxus TaxID=29349 RepID=A0A1V4I6T0_9FIRM|nr:sporulation and spore germination [[Clostridium] thermoalcaliphilum]
MKKTYICVLVFAIIAILAGCSVRSTETIKKEEIKLYYGNLDNSKIEWIIRPIQYSNETEKYSNALKELINGPYSSDMIRNINENTKILSIQNRDSIIYLDLSKEFLLPSSDISQMNAIITITNTLTQFNEIEGVRITVAGKSIVSPSGEPYKVLSEFNLAKNRKINIRLYLPDDNAEYLLPKVKEIEIGEGESIGQRILEELIQESNEGGYGIIPKGAKLISYSEDKGIATVNFSKEFIENHQGGSTGETMTIYSIVNSLTELENITGVLFLIEGEKRENLGHYSINEPFRRAENLIKQ